MISPPDRDPVLLPFQEHHPVIVLRDPLLQRASLPLPVCHRLHDTVLNQTGLWHPPSFRIKNYSLNSINQHAESASRFAI